MSRSKLGAVLGTIAVCIFSLALIGGTSWLVWGQLSRLSGEMKRDWPKVKADFQKDFEGFKALPLRQSIPLGIGMPIGFGMALNLMWKSGVLARNRNQTWPEIKARAKFNLKLLGLCFPVVLVCLVFPKIASWWMEPPVILVFSLALPLFMFSGVCIAMVPMLFLVSKTDHWFGRHSSQQSSV